MQNRRSFLTVCGASIAGLLSFAGLGRAKEEEESHYFDWAEEGPDGSWPYTTDPRYKGQLSYGLHNHVLCNGIHICARARRFQTGPDGWVESLAVDEKGNPKYEIFDRWENKVLTAPPLPQWQIRHPDHLDGNGNLIPRYEERLVYNCTHGFVEFYMDVPIKPIPCPITVHGLLASRFWKGTMPGYSFKVGNADYY